MSFESQRSQPDSDSAHVLANGHAQNRERRSACENLGGTDFQRCEILFRLWLQSRHALPGSSLQSRHCCDRGVQLVEGVAGDASLEPNTRQPRAIQPTPIVGELHEHMR